MSLVGLIGGTGDLGRALALHLAKKHPVLLGSRDEKKAKLVVDEILAEKGYDYLARNLKPAENSAVVTACEILVLTVPHGNALETVVGLATKFRGDQTLISAAASVSKNGEEFKSSRSELNPSITQKIKAVVPETVRVAAAFQTVPANILYRERDISADVPVAAQSAEAYGIAASLISEIQGLRPLFLGSLELSGDIEGLTALLLNIGKRNGLKSPTLKFPSF
jgi:8-hydroxy-5-deazaflavin:NADPH oxidoreductase